ncbi:sensor histidine kinase [Streptomyces sp. NPDC097727]|uniref:sensor histidine kinase n=1 Tax=Streptomyces sp. NPDC097727 TaxID=3366092 RepID=UPI00382A96D5
MIHAFRARTRTQQFLLGLAGALVLALLIAEGLATGYAPTTMATIASGAVCVTALLVPPARFPMTAAVAAVASCALTVTTMQLTHRPEVTPGLTELGALLLMIARAVRQHPPLRAVTAAAGAGIAAMLLPLRLPEQEWSHVGAYLGPGILFAMVLMVVLGLYLRLVDTLREREREADRQAQRLEYARDLHDFVAHHVTAIVAQARAVRFASAAGHAPSPAELDKTFARIEEAGTQTMESMRRMVSVMRHPAAAAATGPVGDLTRLQDLTEEFSRAGSPAALSLDAGLADYCLPPELTTAIHCVVRESLTNVRKHADRVGQVTVDIHLLPGDPQRMKVEVRDDGRGGGSQHGRKTDSEGYGLLGLTERVEAVGGHLTAGRRTDHEGWQVVADLPLPTRRSPLSRSVIMDS